VKRRRMTADERRSQIARAATRLFARHGFSGVTTRQIADAAGVNEALLYRHFPNKEALYTEIIKRKLEEQGGFLDPAMLEGEDDDKIMKYIITAFIDQISGDKAFMRLMLFSGLEDHRLSTEFLGRRIGDVVPHVARYFARRIESGAFRRIDPRIAMRALVGMVIHFILSNEIFKMPEAMRVTREEAIEGFGKVFLEGVRAR
jgi:TetR/AcrR family transcriptional regulator